MTGFTCTNFDQFEQHYGPAVAEDVLTRICEADGARGATPGISLHGVHRHDAINATLEGVLLHDGIEFSFIVDNGDRNGTEVLAFTTEDLAPYEVPLPTRYTLVPVDDQLKEKRPAMYKAYLLWRRETWFQELLRAYHYDRYVQPGVVVENHYRGKAAERGLKLVTTDSTEALRVEADLA